MNTALKVLKDMFTPFANLSRVTKTIMIILQIFLVLLYLQLNDNKIIPTPVVIFYAICDLVTDPSFLENVISSTMYITKGMILSIFITMILCYSSKLPFFEPIIKFIATLRYLTLSSLLLLFSFYIHDSSNLKNILLIAGIVPYFTTSLLASFNLTKQEVDKAFLNKLNSWETLFEVVIVGKIDQVILVMGQNFAIAWGMICMAEGVAFSDGGIGTLLIKSNKYVQFAPIIALLTVVLVIGLFWDWLFRFIRKNSFPYLKN